MTGRDIVKHQLIRTLLLIPLRTFRHIAGVHMVKKLDPFNNAAFIYIQAWNYSFG
jgi:hypothetical protein